LADRQSRRFLPSDPRVEEPYRLTPQLALRVAILGFIALAVFAVLFLRLWALQVLSGDKYRAEANDNRVRTIRIDAPRGQIVDRNGHVLVTNVPGTRVELWPADLPKSWPAQLKELRQLATITHTPIAQIFKGMKAEAGDPLTPVVVQYGIHSDQISYLDEHRVEFPGVQLANSYLRSYPYQSLAAQILGYTGEINADELKADKKLGYQLGDIIGQAGVESTYDTYLRGHDGSEQLTVDSRGQPTSAVTVKVNPRPGSQLRLTINIGLQQAAERALVAGINDAHATPDGTRADGGAIVALDPNDGSVLALASYPTYEPSVYVGRNPKKLAPLTNPTVAAEKNYPTLDRAIDGLYPPGSVWKPVTALAAMQAHILEPLTSLLCSPTYHIKGVTGRGHTYTNWDPYTDQMMNLTTALTESCDTYFYRVGYQFYLLPAGDGHPLQEWASRFGFGQKTGIDLGPEAPGLVPTPEWRREAYTPETDPKEWQVDSVWKPGDSVELAIGQGDLTVTPIQMARFYAMIANGGMLVTPHVAEDIEQPTSGRPKVLVPLTPPTPTPSGVDPTALQFVQDGLVEATHSSLGTSYGVFGKFPVSIAGKTGTAQKAVSLPGYPNPVILNQSWWCGYGPTAPQKAQIVVCAVIENGGHGGTAAAPAALKVFEKFFKTKPITTNAQASD
jgi:penicillin-binding protein 2